HHHLGDAAYNAGEPDEPDDAIKILEEKIAVLERLAATEKLENLRGKLKQLRVNHFMGIIRQAKATIEEINSAESHVRFANEEIFPHYQTIDRAFVDLIAIDPDNQTWHSQREANLTEMVQGRSLFADRALNKRDPDYRTALRHYQAMQEVNQSHPHIIRNLGLEVPGKIETLKAKADSDGKYKEIVQLITDGYHTEALARFDQEFVRTGNYEHRGVARWLWGLIYAKRHDGEFPPEWEAATGFETLSKHLVRVENSHIEQLKKRLEPWSQEMIWATIDQAQETLRDFETDVEGITETIDKALQYGQTEITPEIIEGREALARIETDINEQREFFRSIRTRETGNYMTKQLNKLEDIKALLKTGNPVRDIQRFLDKIEEEQGNIDQDSKLKVLEEALQRNEKIGRTINDIKLNVKQRIIYRLIDDIEERDSEIVGYKDEMTKLEDELTQALVDKGSAETELAQFRQASEAELATAHQHIAALKEQIRKHDLDKFIVPVVLLIAVLAGTAIASRLGGMVDPATLTTIGWVSVGLLVVYLGFFFWSNYRRDT
ncbi:MAG: hypothetical protein R3264_07775, partial [Anaerolineae bacterium]|nr:hypothetical protein [Anaerolineae bacterium]